MKKKKFVSPISNNNSKIKRKIYASDFRRFYDRGDIPIQIDYKGSVTKLRWITKAHDIDLKLFLPIFFSGLQEKIDPYRFLAIWGSIELIEANSEEKIIECIPLIIIPIKNALNTRDHDIIHIILKIIQKLIWTHKSIGEQLVPYYRQILPIFNLFINKNKNLGDRCEYNQRKNLNIDDLIIETLEYLEITGGEDSFINIKYMIPTYESCINN